MSGNVPSDVAGKLFEDYHVTFSEQDNNSFTLKLAYVNGAESGRGLGSFIVGSGNKFSVFVEVNSTAKGARARLIHVISGQLQGTRVTDMHFANFMLNNYGNPGGVWIDNGQGRVLRDQDGLLMLLSTVANRMPRYPAAHAPIQKPGS